MKNALHRAQEAAEGARERLDFVAQKEFDALADAVDELKRRVDALEGRFSGDAGAAPSPQDGDSPGG